MASNDSEAAGELELTRYLLGMLPAGETERLDEMSIADDDFAGRLRAAEIDLIDAYVTGELPDDLREPFRAQYLRTPRGLQRVRFANALRDYQTIGASSRANALPAPRAALTFSRSTLTLAAAAAVLVAMTAGYLALDNLRLRRQLGDASAARTTLAERERQLRQTLADQMARERTPATASAVRVVAFVLMPPTRGIAEAPAIQLPTDVRLTLQLTLEADDYPQYSVTVTDPSTGAVVARADHAQAQPRPGGKAVEIDILPGVLKPQRYAAELSGLRAGQPADPLSVYPFRIVMP
jgi:hypothetical protein